MLIIAATRDLTCSQLLRRAPVVGSNLGREQAPIDVLRVSK